MNLRDLADIRRRLNPDKHNPAIICGCYIDHIGNPITSFQLPVATLSEQENEEYMSIFKKTLAGQIGQTLTPVEFGSDFSWENADKVLLFHGLHICFFGNVPGDKKEHKRDCFRSTNQQVETAYAD